MTGIKQSKASLRMGRIPIRYCRSGRQTWKDFLSLVIPRKEVIDGVMLGKVKKEEKKRRHLGRVPAKARAS